MSYTITGKRIESDTIFTNVTFLLSNSTEIKVEVAHFRPQSVNEIESNISNREASEEAAIAAITQTQLVYQELETNGN